MNKICKQIIAVLVSVAVLMSLSVTAFAETLPTTNNSSYLICYPLADSGRIYAEGNTSRWIAPSDECRITAIDGNRVYVSYPVKNGRHSEWFSRDAFTTCEINWADCPTIQVSRSGIKTYKRAYGTENLGSLDADDKCYILTKMGNRTQLVYQLSNGNYKMGWVNSSELYSSETENSIFTIHSVLDANLVLDVYAGNNGDGTNIQIYNKHGGSNQQFAVIPKDGWYAFVNTASGKAIDVTGGTSASEVNVQLYSVNYSDAQLWQFESAGTKTYYLRNKLGYYLDAAGGIASNETNVWVYYGNQTPAQKWKFKKLTNDTLAWHESNVDNKIADTSSYRTDLDGYSGITGQCVWYVRNRGYEKLGDAGLTGIGGDAKKWFKSAQNKGLSTGDLPRANSIVCWSGGSYGHVAYVEYYDEASQTVYFTEANWGGHSETNGQLKKMSIEDFKSRKDGYQGCIYLK